MAKPSKLMIAALAPECIAEVQRVFAKYFGLELKTEHVREFVSMLKGDAWLLREIRDRSVSDTLPRGYLADAFVQKFLGMKGESWPLNCTDEVVAKAFYAELLKRMAAKGYEIVVD